jgi:hypothetical protein
MNTTQAKVTKSKGAGKRTRKPSPGNVTATAETVSTTTTEPPCTDRNCARHSDYGGEMPHGDAVDLDEVMKPLEDALAGVADELRTTAAQLWTGEINQWRAAGRLRKIAGRLSGATTATSKIRRTK